MQSIFNPKVGKVDKRRRAPGARRATSMLPAILLEDPAVRARRVRGSRLGGQPQDGDAAGRWAQRVSSADVMQGRGFFKRRSTVFLALPDLYGGRAGPAVEPAAVYRAAAENEGGGMLAEKVDRFEGR